MNQNIDVIRNSYESYTIKTVLGIYTLKPTKHKGNKDYAPYYFAKLKPEYEYISGMYKHQDKGKEYYQGTYKGQALIIDVSKSILIHRPKYDVNTLETKK